MRWAISEHTLTSCYVAADVSIVLGRALAELEKADSDLPPAERFVTRETKLALTAAWDDALDLSGEVPDMFEEVRNAYKALRKVPVKFWDVTKYGRQVGAFCDIRDERFRRAQLVGLLVSVPDFSVLIASPHC